MLQCRPHYGTVMSGKSFTSIKRTMNASPVRRNSALLPSILTFVVIVASGGLLLLIEKGMLSTVENPVPRGGGRRGERSHQDERLNSPARDLDSQLLQDIRNRTIRTMCSQKNMPHNINSLSPQQRRILLQHILVDDQYHFLYCYVPKVACSNWKKVLKVLNGALENVNVNVKMNHVADLKFLSSLKPEEINFRLKHYFKFMFVRDPMERLLSAYKNKFGEIASYQHKYGVEIVKRYRDVAKDAHIKGDDVTFAEFIQYLVDEDVDHMNEHWMPMYNLCQPCVVNYDFIGSHDRIEEDSEFVLQHVGAPSYVHFPVRQTWYKPVTTETLYYYVCSLPQTLLTELLPKYILDFSFFAYPLPNTTSEFCRH
ncbi:carbohydrate sulfotransferase 14 [Antennarius striatus]|uniref:carbohydrate sulfotransferase 14 n=1 Tax=Antennarius striatus TaxID=241820 RepID=UPI0035AF1F14